MWPPAQSNQSQCSDTGSSAFFALIQTWFFSLTHSLSFVVSVFKGEKVSNEEDVNVLWWLTLKKDFIKNSLGCVKPVFLCVTASIGDSFLRFYNDIYTAAVYLNTKKITQFKSKFPQFWAVFIRKINFLAIFSLNPQAWISILSKILWCHHTMKFDWIFSFF